MSIVRLVELQWWPWPVDLRLCPLFPPFSSVLFNEVRYVHTPAELLRVESAARQNSDIVVGHIPVLGLPGTISIFSIVHCLGWNKAILYISCLFVFVGIEHRALMEAAFVYGTKYQFVQMTGTLLLKHMGYVLYYSKENYNFIPY